MKLQAVFFIVAIFAPLALLLVSGHSYLTEPPSRSNQAQTQTGCRGPACLGPCDSPRSKAGQITPPTPVRRGDKIELRWPRNNHAGGFIRVAWAPLNLSDEHSAFDSNVQLLTCHEMTCEASNFASDPLGGDSDGAAPGKCSSSIEVPPQLTDGEWTLQWAWFGGAFQLGDYYSCADMSVSGGTEVDIRPMRVTYVGGDVHNRGSDKCLFFNTNKLHECVNEPCTNGASPGQNSGHPDGILPKNPSSENIGAPVEPAISSQTDRHETATSTAETVTSETNTAASSVAETSPTATSSLPLSPTDSAAPAADKPADNTAHFSIKDSKGDDTILVSYSTTFNDGKAFGAVVKLDNTGNDDETGWSLMLLMPQNMKLLYAFGAELVPTDLGHPVYMLNSTAPLKAVQPLEIGLMGEII